MHVLIIEINFQHKLLKDDGAELQSRLLGDKRKIKDRDAKRNVNVRVKSVTVDGKNCLLGKDVTCDQIAKILKAGDNVKLVEITDEELKALSDLNLGKAITLAGKAVAKTNLFAKSDMKPTSNSSVAAFDLQLN